MSEEQKPSDFQIPAVRVWFYAGPIILDALAILCTTVLVALHVLEVDSFKYLIGVLVVGNLAMRVPGANKMIPPGGGGFIFMVLTAAVHTLRLGLKS